MGARCLNWAGRAGAGVLGSSGGPAGLQAGFPGRRGCKHSRAGLGGEGQDGPPHRALCQASSCLVRGGGARALPHPPAWTPAGSSPSPHHQPLQPAVPRPQLLEALGLQQASRPRAPPGSPIRRADEMSRIWPGLPTLGPASGQKKPSPTKWRPQSRTCRPSPRCLWPPPLQTLGLWGGFVGPKVPSPWSPFPHRSWSSAMELGTAAARCPRKGGPGLFLSPHPQPAPARPEDHRGPSPTPEGQRARTPRRPAHLPGPRSRGRRTRLGPRRARRAGSSWRAARARCSGPPISGRRGVERPGSRGHPPRGLSRQHRGHRPPRPPPQAGGGLLLAARPLPGTAPTLHRPEQRAAPVWLRGAHRPFLRRGGSTAKLFPSRTTGRRLQPRAARSRHQGHAQPRRGLPHPLALADGPGQLPLVRVCAHARHARHTHAFSATPSGGRERGREGGATRHRGPTCVDTRPAA